jgi:hypothetical protein
MKTVTNPLGILMLVILLSGAALDVCAQGRGRDNEIGNGNPGRGNNKENHPGKGHGKEYGHKKYDSRTHHETNTREWQSNYPSRGEHRYNQYDHRDRYVTYNHHHSHPSWAPAYGYRYNTRYIYYQDYNVYYDSHRDVFLVWTGRNWSVSTRIPDVMFRVDFERARVAGVDYWDDDLNFYLQRRRPSYLSISAAW